MNDDQYILQQALDALEHKTGIKSTIHPAKSKYDASITLVVKKHTIRFNVAVKKQINLYHIDPIIAVASNSQPFMIIATAIANTARDKLQSNGISYIESNGNAFISYDQTLIIIDGNKPLPTTKPVTNRAFTKTGLKAVFHLLNDPHAINKTYRQLSAETNIALGNIKYILDGLDEAGFLLPITDKKIALKNKPALLERWLAGYRETLKPDLLQGTYKPWDKEKREEWQSINTKDLGFVWGGEAAAEIMTNYLQAKNLTLYTNDHRKVGAGLTLVPAADGDVLVYDRFWHIANNNDTLAPALLIYADLIITDDPRCVETANIIYQKTLKDVFERD